MDYNQIFSLISNFGLVSTIKSALLNFSFQDGLDVFFTSIIIGSFLHLFKKTRTVSLVISSIVSFIFIYLIASWLNLYTILSIINALLGGIVVILVIVFQKELRRFIEWVSLDSIRKRFSQKNKQNQKESSHNLVDIIASVAFLMAKRKMGGIIVFPGKESIDSFVSGGFELEGKVSEPLLLSIFDTSTPGHDGAVIIDQDIVKKFGVVLPLSERDDYQKLNHLGTRHRSALGLSERTDAMCVVISEEKKRVSVAFEGTIEPVADEKDLKEKLNAFLNVNKTDADQSHLRLAKVVTLIKRNYKEALLSLIFAFVFWLIVSFPHSGIVIKEFSAPIVFENLSSNVSIEKLNTANVAVFLSGTERDFKFVNKDDIKVVIDLSSSSLDHQTKYVLVHLDEKNVRFPSNLNLIKILPSQLEFKLVFSN
jgi:uncharacterized protein (TIGR00159 family)